MILENISLVNYRNHKKLKLDFDEKINLIIGQNGTGKTNILEAINIISTSKSFRARYDRDLINYDASFTKIQAKISDGTEDLTIDLTISKSNKDENRSVKKLKINDVPKALYVIGQSFNTVLFSPEDIDFITGTPSLRRKYINLTLWQTDNKYKKFLLLYNKALKQRNKLLGNINEYKTGLDQLPFWNAKLLEYGEYIQIKREEYLAFINNFLEKIYKEHTLDINKIAVEYNANLINTERLTEYKDKEIFAKTSLIGPHRDDFIIYQDEREISEFGSRGEQRTSIFLIKIAELDYFSHKINKYPVLLLDDIFSELDESHQQFILKLIKNQQTIISTTTKDSFLSLEIKNQINI